VSWATVGAVLALGVFHGANPAMGWLFAVALGQQQRAAARPGAPIGPARTAAVAVGAPGAGSVGGAGRWGVLRALPPIAAGHLASVAAVAVAFAVTESAVASRAAAIVGGVLLVGLGTWRLLSNRHFRWVGMRLSARELAGWSFLMSSVHGAGLMLIPVLAHHSPLPPTASALTALAAAALHTLAMLATAAAIALLVSGLLDLSVLRHAWLNTDRIWAAALLTAGIATLVTSTA
jgi:hypothetical protein